MYEPGAYRLPGAADVCARGGCEELAKVTGFCPRHAIERYIQTTTRRPLPARYRPAARNLCSADDCKRSAPLGSLCGRHRRQMERKGRLTRLPHSRRPGASQVRDASGRKECGMCLQWLHVDEYSQSSVYPDGRIPYCAACVTATRYGLSGAELIAKREASGGLCDVCGGTNQNGRQLAIDHDHACCRGTRSCGRCVRGLLCGACNFGVGFLADHISTVRRAAEYLTAWKAAGPRSEPIEPPRGGRGPRWAKYRLSAAAYEDLLTRQGGACAVCTASQGDRALVVDHDHDCCASKGSCGRCVRGLLCGKCNSGIGMFKDSPELLRKAIAYLEKYAT